MEEEISYASRSWSFDFDFDCVRWVGCGSTTFPFYRTTSEAFVYVEAIEACDCVTASLANRIESQMMMRCCSDDVVAEESRLCLD